MFAMHLCQHPARFMIGLDNKQRTMRCFKGMKSWIEKNRQYMQSRRSYHAILWLNLRIATIYGSLCMCSMPWFEGLMFRFRLQTSCRVLFSTNMLWVLDEYNLKNFRNIRTSKECPRDPKSHLEHPVGSSSQKDRKIVNKKFRKWKKETYKEITLMVECHAIIPSTLCLFKWIWKLEIWDGKKFIKTQSILKSTSSTSVSCTCNLSALVQEGIEVLASVVLVTCQSLWSNEPRCKPHVLIKFCLWWVNTSRVYLRKFNTPSLWWISHRYTMLLYRM